MTDKRKSREQAFVHEADNRRQVDRASHHEGLAKKAGNKHVGTNGTGALRPKPHIIKDWRKKQGTSMQGRIV
jgi:hypothetical protein